MITVDPPKVNAAPPGFFAHLRERYRDVAQQIDVTRTRLEREEKSGENKRAAAGVHITGDRPVTRFGYWSIRTVVSPEPYIDLNIEPGKASSWRITYEFYQVSPSAKTD